MLHCRGSFPNSCWVMPGSDHGRREQVFLCGSCIQFTLLLRQIIDGIQKHPGHDNLRTNNAAGAHWEKKKIKECEIICWEWIFVSRICILQISGSRVGNAIFLDVSLTAQNPFSWVLQLNSFSRCLNSLWLPALKTDAHPLLIVDYCSHDRRRKAKPP